METLPRHSGRFLEGHRYSRETEFKKGEHWRSPKPYWDKSWLYNEYITKKKSITTIAHENECNYRNISYFLKKHSIRSRSTSETRKFKYWGQSGKDNPMFGRTGTNSPNWKGGITPERQTFYESEEWKKACFIVWKRDDATCQRCKTKHKSGNRAYHIHHIISFEVRELRAEHNNLVLLCQKCHRWVHSKKNIEKEFIIDV